MPSKTTTQANSLAREVADLLALGYLRYRKSQARRQAVEKEATGVEKPLDDVTPRGRVGTGERRTPETGGDA